MCWVSVTKDGWFSLKHKPNTVRSSSPSIQEINFADNVNLSFLAIHPSLKSMIFKSFPDAAKKNATEAYNNMEVKLNAFPTLALDGEYFVKPAAAQAVSRLLHTAEVRFLAQGRQWYL
jgi:hypothetical protein